MSLTEILSSLEEKSQKSFLERMINKVDSLNDGDFEMLLSFSSSKYPDLAVQYLLNRKRNEEAIKLLEDNKKYLEAAKLCAEFQLFEKAAWNYYREGLLFCTARSGYLLDEKLNNISKSPSFKESTLLIILSRNDF